MATVPSIPGEGAPSLSLTSLPYLYRMISECLIKQERQESKGLTCGERERKRERERKNFSPTDNGRRNLALFTTVPPPPPPHTYSPCSNLPSSLMPFHCDFCPHCMCVLLQAKYCAVGVCMLLCTRTSHSPAQTLPPLSCLYLSHVLYVLFWHYIPPLSTVPWKIQSHIAVVNNWLACGRDRFYYLLKLFLFLHYRSWSKGRCQGRNWWRVCVREGMVLAVVTVSLGFHFMTGEAAF